MYKNERRSEGLWDGQAGHAELCAQTAQCCGPADGDEDAEVGDYLLNKQYEVDGKDGEDGKNSAEGD